MTTTTGGQSDRDELAATNDPQLAAQRDLLEDGGSYPPIDIGRSVPVDGEFEARADEPVEVTVPVTTGDLTADGVGIRRFVVVQCRSTGHNGEFELAVHVAAAGDFPTTIEAEDPRFVGIIGFFDHLDDSHADEIDCVDAPLGQYVIDITGALEALARNDPDAEPAVQFRLVTPDDREPSTQSLQLSGLSIVELAG